MISEKSASAMLRSMVTEWQSNAPFGSDDSTFSNLLAEALFNARFRYHHYSQFADEEGEFPARLLRWLMNVDKPSERKALLRLLPHIFFVDKEQTVALYRDAFRRIVRPWLTRDVISPLEQLSPDYEQKVRAVLAQYRIYSITESFNLAEFIQCNSLRATPKPRVLGEDKNKVVHQLPSSGSSVKGIIILEDFVGTGKQAGRILAEVRHLTPEDRRILFVPLLILYDGVNALRSNPALKEVDLEPVVVIDRTTCLRKKAVVGEPEEFAYIRSLIRKTDLTVRERLEEDDDLPVDAFGYGGQGSLVVPYHNTPNNTLPLIHHRAPRWSPLFRRVHHLKGSD